MRARPALLVASPFIVVGALAAVACTPEPGPAPPMTKGFPDDFATVGHEPFFPIGPGAKHALSGTITCDGCHGGKETFKEFTCLGCHARNATARDDLESKHGGMGAAFQLEDSFCYHCHPRGERSGGSGGEGEGEGDIWGISRAEHAPFFPVDSAAGDIHGGAGCGACHGDYGGDPMVTNCRGCHAAPTEADLFAAHTIFDPIYTANNTETGCLECHAGTPINPAVRPFSNHNAVSGPSGGFGTNHFAPENCKVCHNTYQTEPKEWAIDFSTANCTADCHGVNDPHDAACTPGDQTGC